MKKSLSLFLSLLFTTTSVAAQEMDSLFVKAGADIFPLLRKEARMDMLDYFNYKMAAKADNALGGKSELKKLNSHYLFVQSTESSTIEMRRLSINTNTIISVVRNLKAGDVTSHISFYNSHWQQVRVNFPTIGARDFLRINDTLTVSQQQRILDLLSPLNYTMHWSVPPSSSPTLTLTLSLSRLSKEMRQRILPHIRPITYLWNNGRFERRQTPLPNDNNPTTDTPRTS